MKQNSTKILVVLIALILVVGIIMIFTKGLAFDLRYQDAKKIELNIGQEFTISDMRSITKEVFGNQSVLIQQVEVYKDSASITTSEITDEQKSDLIAKINEKYGTELKADDITVEETTHVRGRDIIKPYILPFVVSTALALLYVVIRYYKLNALDVLVKSVGIIALSQLVLLCIMAITRMPIGNFTIPLVLIVYVLSMFMCTTKFEEDLAKLKIKEEEK